MATSPREKRDFLRITDLDRSELLELVERAAEWKLLGKGGPRPLERRTVGLVFEKASTRTRVSFEVAAHQLGAGSIMLSPRDTQLGRGEPIRDTARVLSRYLDCLVVRTYGHEKIEEMARYAGVPVVNALTDASHPCQVLADLLTVTERFGSDALTKPGLRVAWVGDGNNMANSWLEACVLLGFELHLACPAGYDPDPALLARAAGRAKVFRSPAEAVAGAHVVNTDVWASMGQEQEAEERRRRFEGFIVDGPLMARARPNAVVLHCLPAHRGEEITDEVLEGPQSAVFDEAENRLHAQKALLELLLAGR
ncbi:ornithine carbamoyltransferase [Anaeromyxobacter sp. K]|uniref:Ornithine carbamoyltransferase n=1 Tax=Anaeromyxobacter dehalogenans (strain ATCC BAA-258 / DSM 21875 / 2CP-1) TaxID=455488 RepID=B8JER8_ANAD2|nr:MULTISPECIES: ornithine carbamoyltransferase [Anaeromyxobacter]ACG74009.1 ornithine carbamoyltransferase [Anaeromyxobacter sp. K]ACL66214.1 ornithine carbamoyltransferase [Anaeromyxobacter dehalogenans 2CP-1]